MVQVELLQLVPVFHRLQTLQMGIWREGSHVLCSSGIYTLVVTIPEHFFHDTIHGTNDHIEVVLVILHV